MGGSVYFYCTRCKIERKAKRGDKHCPRCGNDLRFLAYVTHQGQKIRKRSNHEGIPLDSYDKAAMTLYRIREEISTPGRFKAENYDRKAQKRFLFESQIEEFLRHEKGRVEVGDICERTAYKNANAIRAGIVPWFKGRNVRSIRNKDILDFYHHLLGKYSATTTGQTLSQLKAFHRWLMVTETIEKPWSFPKMKSREREIFWIDRQTQDAILDEIPRRHRGIFLFMFRQGCRPAEARALQWRDIDLEKGLIILRRSLSHRGVVRETTKAGSVIRQAIDPEVSEWIKAHRGIGGAWVFQNKGGPYSHQKLARLWSNARAEVGLDKVSLYQATRHSFASQKIEAGYRWEDVGGHMGHRNPSTTSKYVHRSWVGSKRLFAPVEELPSRKVPVSE